MKQTKITIYAGTNLVFRKLRFPGVILTGSVVELQLLNRLTSETRIVSSESEFLTIKRDTLIWTYDDELVMDLPRGSWTAFDIFRTPPGSDVREKLATGEIEVVGYGEIEGESPTVIVEVPGISGPQGWGPITAVIPRDDGLSVQQIVDWVGGGGTKPGIGQYVGIDGLVNDINDAISFPSGPQGEQGLKGDRGDRGPPAMVNGKTGEEIEILATDIQYNANDATVPGTVGYAITQALTGAASVDGGEY